MGETEGGVRVKIKLVDKLDSGYASLEAIARLKGFWSPQKGVMIPIGYTIMTDKRLWNIIKDKETLA